MIRKTSAREPNAGDQAARALRAFSATYFVVLMGHSIWRMTFYNYALETFDLTPQDIGYLFSIASIPGTVAIVIAILEHRLSFRLVTTLATGLLGIGLILLGSVGRAQDLWLGTLLVSAGIAWFLPLANKIVIREHETSNVSEALGRLKSLGPAAGMAAAVLIYAAVRNADAVAAFLVAAGLITLLSGFWCAQRSRPIDRELASLQLRFSKHLRVYYLLNFLAGSRSAIFKTFVISQLVVVHRLEPAMVSATILAGSFASLLGYRLIGYLGSVWDPAKLLMGLYLLVACLFAGFTVAEGIALFTALFLLDALLFGSATLTDAHLKHASDPDRLTGDLSVGFSFYHLAGVVVPPATGLIWSLSGNVPAVLMGTVICLAAAVAGHRLRTSETAPS